MFILNNFSVDREFVYPCFGNQRSNETGPLIRNTNLFRNTLNPYYPINEVNEQDTNMFCFQIAH